MNKRAILITIGLMGAALFGVAWLQVKWIQFSIELNEERFEKNVYAALSNVAERLEYEEQAELYNFMNNGYVRSYIESEMRQRIEDGDLMVSFSFENLSPGEVNMSKQDLLKVLISDQECDCAACTEDRIRKFSQGVQYVRGLDFTPLDERIKLDKLDEAIQMELNDHGINIEYKYGVFSKKRRSFVIANNHYMVQDDNPQVTKEGYKNLYTSKYRVNLFQTQDGQSPGLLMVHFPSKASYVWASVWRTLVAAILFTGVILFCFAYTIQVIFLQKKLSEMKTDFINNMTHEFKTPIATISLAADSITSPMIAGKQEKVQRFADIIKQENKRMNSQVEKVLQMAVLDKQEFNLKLTDVDMHEVIGRAIENIGLQVEKKGGTATSDLQAEQFMVQGDLTHISNMINNLLDNANKYSPDQPEINGDYTQCGKRCRSGRVG